MIDQNFVINLFEYSSTNVWIIDGNNEVSASGIALTITNNIQHEEYPNLYLANLGNNLYNKVLRGYIPQSRIMVIGLDALSRDVIVNVFENLPTSVTKIGLNNITEDDLEITLKQLGSLKQAGRNITIVCGDNISKRYKDLFNSLNVLVEQYSSPAAAYVASKTANESKKKTPPTQITETATDVICKQIDEIIKLRATCAAYKRKAEDEKARNESLNSELTAAQAKNLSLMAELKNNEERIRQLEYINGDLISRLPETISFVPLSAAGEDKNNSASLLLAPPSTPIRKLNFFLPSHITQPKLNSPSSHFDSLDEKPKDEKPKESKKRKKAGP